jgi:hypothetical protein
MDQRHLCAEMEIKHNVHVMQHVIQNPHVHVTKHVIGKLQVNVLLAAMTMHVLVIIDATVTHVQPATAHVTQKVVLAMEHMELNVHHVIQ